MTSHKVNPLLEEERAKCTFPVEEMTYFHDLGQEKTLERRALERVIVEDPNFNFPVTEFLSRDEQYGLAVKKHCLRLQKLRELGITDHYLSYHFARMIGNHESNPFAVHFIMFTPALMSQGSEEQQSVWLTKALNYEIVGTYAQTELGHGTFIRGIETTAHYDEATQEFVLNTPTISATKFWPGHLGKTANIVMLVAQLHTRAGSHGLHYFIVPIRDTVTHKILPGVTVGDIGPKFGFPCSDNGFLQLHKVRIPRENMLAKHAEVLPCGRYVTKREKTEKLTYGTMLLVRSVLVHSTGYTVAEAVTIATRYSAIRLQGHAVSASEDVSPSPSGSGLQPQQETKLLDYPTQQMKLVTQLANAYALQSAGLELRQLFFRVQGEVEAGLLNELPKIHALSAGLKALSTWDAAEGIEVCRMACGGHGYSLASGLPQIYADAVAACTYEGDNTVLLLTTCRYLLKNFTQSTEFSANSPVPLTSNGEMCVKRLLKAHEKRAYRLVERLHGKFSAALADNRESWENLFRQHATELVRTAHANCRSMVCSMFYNAVLRAHVSIQPVLMQLVQFYALHWLLEEVGDFLLSDCFPRDITLANQCVDLLRLQREHLLQALRPNMVGLVDAFDLHDRVLNSVLGRKDGLVYENLLEYAKKSPLNATEVHPSFHEYLGPFLKGETIRVKAKL